jgi:hypothetical protein
MICRGNPFDLGQSIRAAFISVLIVHGVNGCSKGNRGPEPIIEAGDAEPSREDLIQAVRNSVAGKEYVEQVAKTRSVPHQEEVVHTCTQYDVDLDPYAKHNPELAKCPRVTTN